MRGDELFTDNGFPRFSMLDFWEYQFSNVYTLQEHIAEFLVSKALHIDKPINRDGWSLYDILYKNVRIEVKQTAYYYPWQKRDKDGNHEISQRRAFDISPAYSEYKNPQSELKRQSDIYVFCVNTGTTEETAYPLDINNWEFYVVPTSKINKLDENRDVKQKKISLGRVKELGVKCTFEELKEVVDNIIKDFEIK